MPVIKDKEFRFNFGLDKVTGEITNRQFLETLKKVISEFGFVIDVVENIMKDDNRKSMRGNTYVIDLDITIIELLNLSTRDYFDDIVNGVSSNFNENVYDDEKSNEDDDFESDEEYIDMDE